MDGFCQTDKNVVHSLNEKDKLAVLQGFASLCNFFLGIGFDLDLQYLLNISGLFQIQIQDLQYLQNFPGLF